MAVDFETGRIFVADRNNNRVDVFEDNGTFLLAFGWGVDTGVAAFQTCTIASTCQAGIAGSGAGQFDHPTQIAVDNIVGSGSRHDVYIGTDSFRVQKFSAGGSFLAMFGKGVNNGTSGNPDICTNVGAPTDVCGSGSKGGGEGQFNEDNDPVAVGPGGKVFVADSPQLSPANFSNRIEKFLPSGAYLEKVELFKGNLISRSLAVDSSEDVYVTVEGAGGQIRKYDLSGPTRLCEAQLDPGTEATALAVDGADNLFATQRQQGGILRVITEYSPGCAHLRRFGYGKLASPSPAVAPHPAALGDVLASQEGGAIKYLAFPPAGPIAPPSSVEAPMALVGNVRATLKAEVNPEGKPTNYHFEYVDQKGFEEQGNGFTGPHTKSTAVTALGDEDFDLHTVEAKIGCIDALAEIGEGKCLSPETTYRFRLIATNADGPGEGEVTGAPFLTKPALEIRETFATDVATDAAKLSAVVNPLGIPTSGYFEYVDEASFQKSGFADAIKVPAVDKGAGELSFGAGEVPATRSVVVSPLAPGTTYRYRVVAKDPLIAPVTFPQAGKEPSFSTFAPVAEPPPCPVNEPFRTGASALLPDCRAYELVSPLDKENGDTIPLKIGIGAPASLDQSAVSGTKFAYGTYRAFGDSESAPYTSQYISERDPEVGWKSHSLAPPRTHLALEGLNMLDTEFKAFSPDLCQAWIRTVSEPVLAAGGVPGYPNLYHRQDQGCGAKSYQALTVVKPPSAAPQTYSEGLEVQGASADGSVVIFTANDRLTAEAPLQPPSCVSESKACRKGLYEHSDTGALSYLCILPSGETLEGACSAGAGLLGSGAGEGRQANLSNAISADGSRIYWTAAESGSGKIYLRIPGEDKTIAVSKKAEELSGTAKAQYWTAADDGSKAIFTTGASAGDQDLYEFAPAGEVTSLIATGVSGVLGASEDASHVYFTSSDVLAGPSAEGRSPQAGEGNLYLAHAGSTEFIMTLAKADPLLLPPTNLVPTQRTTRVAPDGLHAIWMSVASPTGYDNKDATSGNADAEVFRYDASSKELVCATCNPSGARPMGKQLGSGLWVGGQIQAWATSLYAPRVLSDDGSRIYFESTDALVGRDSNGVGDVYQWEEVGAGGCEKGDGTFSASARGCIDLISSGQSAQASRFTDASPSGDDVFFTTLAGLLSQDYGLTDVYDARADGGFPPPPKPAPECEGEACQSPASPPQYQTPASALYRGPDNVIDKPKKKRCAKGKVARKGRCVTKPKAGKNKPTTHRMGAGR